VTVPRFKVSVDRGMVIVPLKHEVLFRGTVTVPRTRVLEERGTVIVPLKYEVV